MPKPTQRYPIHPNPSNYSMELYLSEIASSIKLIVRKRDISGDDLRREFWVHEEANSPKKKKKEGRGYDVKLDQPKVEHFSSFGWGEFIPSR